MAKVTPTVRKPVAPKNSAAPGSADNKAEKQSKVSYPGLFNEAGEDIKLTTIPTDWDHKLHQPLTRKSFEDESLWFTMRAVDCEKRAKFYRDAAEDHKKLGNVKDRAKAKKLVQMQKRFDELKAQLASQGVDVDSLLSGSNTDAE